MLRSGGLFGQAGRLGLHITFVAVLTVAVPALFLGGLLGLRTRILLAAQKGLANGAGFVLGCFGATMGILARTPYWEMTERWWVPLLAGLTLMALAASSKRGTKILGAVVLVSGVLGWVSVLSDPAFPGVLVPLRPVHVAFAAAFCLSSVSWA